MRVFAKNIAVSCVFSQVAELSRNLFVDDVTDGLWEQDVEENGACRHLTALVREPTKEVIGFVSYSVKSPTVSGRSFG